MTLWRNPSRPPAGDVRPAAPTAGCSPCLSQLKLTVFGDIGCYTLGATAAAQRAWTPRSAWARPFGMAPRLHHHAPGAGEEHRGRASAIARSCTRASPGVVNIVYNLGVSTDASSLDNAITGMTGHQQNPTTGLTLQKRAHAEAITHRGRCARAAGVPGERPRGRSPATWPETEPRAARGAGQGRAFGHHRPAAPARCSSTSRHRSAAAHRSRKVPRLPRLHEDRAARRCALRSGKAWIDRDISASAAACARRPAASRPFEGGGEA